MNKDGSLGAIIRDRRLALGYSLGQLATRVHKTAASIRAWEKGDSVPDKSEVPKLADVLDLDAELLAGLLSDAAASTPKAAPAETATAKKAPAKKRTAEKAPATKTPAKPSPGEPPPAEGELAESGPTGSDPIPTDVTATEPAAEVSPRRPREPADRRPAEAKSSERSATEEVGRGDAAATADEAADIDSSRHVAATEPAEAAAGASQPAGLADAGLEDARTEAVPVVPAGSVAVASRHAEPDVRAAEAQPIRAPADNPLVRAWDTAFDWYRRAFDPRNKWIYRVRVVLLLIAFYLMLRVLGWAGGELLEAIGDALDSFSFTPTETPDIET